MYVTRQIEATVQTAIEQFPAILITGPRQSGKSTLLLERFSDDSDYVTFDDPLERAFAAEDPNGFLDRFERQRRHVILDEIQYVPEILPHLKIRIDQDRRSDAETASGRWLLTGSQNFQLMARIGESLAGRVAILELPPLSLVELPADDLAERLWTGGYPEPALQPEKRDLWISSYIQTYVERDVRQLHNITDLRAFETFLALCAARHGQELNMADLSRQVGISQPTVKQWLGVLEAAYLIILVPPYFENFGKRVIKRPKLYFLDSALVTALTRQPSADAALHGSLGGALFEGFLVTETFKSFAGRGRKPELYYWRSRDQLEVDLLVRRGDRLIPIEIKLSASPTPRHALPLSRFAELAGSEPGVVVCRVPEARPLPSGRTALPWRDFPAWLEEQVGTAS